MPRKRLPPRAASPSFTIAEHAAQVMAEKGMTTIWYGDPDELHQIADRAGIADRGRSVRGQHPLNVINKVLAALERSPRFEKRYIKHLGRPARAFVLRKPPRARAAAAKVKKTKRSSAGGSRI